MNEQRKRAWDLINTEVESRICLSLDDLADSVTLMNGLDTIESLLRDGATIEAKKEAQAVADEVIEEEGFGLFL